MSWQQLRNEAAANSRFEFPHDFLEPETVRRLQIELAQRSNSSRHRSSKYGEACPRRSQCKELSVSSPSSGSLARRRTLALATMETAY
jgi:hypothetical protein